jgi:hypothetical protein
MKRIFELENENQEWKNRYSQLENTKNLEFEEFK